MVGEGCILKECTVKRSVVGIRSRIETGCVVDNALLMGADYYESPLERMKASECGKVPLGVGANTTIRRAIVDKNARIGRNVHIVNQGQRGGGKPGRSRFRHPQRHRRHHQERDHSRRDGDLNSSLGNSSLHEKRRQSEPSETNRQTAEARSPAFYFSFRLRPSCTRTDGIRARR